MTQASPYAVEHIPAAQLFYSCFDCALLLQQFQPGGAVAIDGCC